jgi:hypothetical protein
MHDSKYEVENSRGPEFSHRDTITNEEIHEIENIILDTDPTIRERLSAFTLHRVAYNILNHQRMNKK